MVAATTIDEWVAQNSDKDERLLCKREFGGEYFFLAQRDDKLKLGSRLDMSEYSKAHTFIVSWILRDEKNESPVTKDRPISVKDKHVHSGSKAFAESVEYRTINVPRSHVVNATIAVKKCPTAECDRRRTISKEEKEYSVEICEAALSK
jgi:hypothetical protein